MAAPAAALPPPLPVGTIAEYQETANLGQWQQVPPGTGKGNVLIVPAQVYEPVGTPFLFNVYGAGCGPGATTIEQYCACVAHDANLGGVKGVGYNTSPRGKCIAEILDCNPDTGFGGCCQTNADAFNGQPLTTWYPDWFLNEYRVRGLLPPERESLGLVIDWWTVFCFQIQETIPNFFDSLHATCPPPGRIQLVNGVPTCQMDPPVPPFLLPVPPFGRPNLAILPFTAHRATSVRTASLPATNARSAASISASLRKMAGLNPTLKRGIPYIVKPCGCGDGDFEEVI